DRHRPPPERAHHERDPDVLVPVVRGYAAQGSVTPVLRAIPSTGERIPALGLGTWQAFDVGDPARRGPLREVLRRFVDLGGRVVDSSPMYGAAEAAGGALPPAPGGPDARWVAARGGEAGAGGRRRPDGALARAPARQGAGPDAGPQPRRLADAPRDAARVEGHGPHPLSRRDALQRGRPRPAGARHAQRAARLRAAQLLAGR